jgi:predicted lipid-binding transport protein (Tim44 family)
LVLCRQHKEHDVQTSHLIGAFAIALVGIGASNAAEAHPNRHHYRHDREGHGRCLRFNKTTGSVAGAVGGGLLGNAIIGGPGGLIVGAAAGGIAGHELAHNRRKHC